MSEMVICKSCGFVMEKSRVRDKCPACGVSARMFLPHDERISPARKRILALDLHPVLVHFPQAFTSALVALPLLALVVRGPWHDRLVAATAVLAIALPLVVLLAFAAGLLDGWVRFRRMTTPLLTRKIVFGAIFFALACALAALAMLRPLDTAGTMLGLAGLSVLALGCASLLGFIGVSVLNARFPG
jgi:uncharacterized membrane protein